MNFEVAFEFDEQKVKCTPIYAEFAEKGTVASSSKELFPTSFDRIPQIVRGYVVARSARRASLSRASRRC